MPLGLIPGAEEKLNESARALVAFNGAGIGGTIGLMQALSPHAPLGIRICGTVFLVGFFAAITAWVVLGIEGLKVREGFWESLLGPMAVVIRVGYLLGLSAFLFVVGVSWAFGIAVSSP